MRFERNLLLFNLSFLLNGKKLSIEPPVYCLKKDILESVSIALQNN